MSKVTLRRLIIAALFSIIGLFHYLSTKDYQVIILGAVFAVITILLEALFYSKRGIFLYALLGLIAGYFSGKFMFDVFASILPNFFVKKFEPYFILTFTYMGFFLPYMATGKRAYAMDFPLGTASMDTEKRSAELKLLDTSVIIDGRVADIAETGFISGTLVVPKFVLNEIQALADSQDPIKRSRARRGLDVLNKLKEIHTVDLKISSRDFSDVKGVDTKLIALAKELVASIITNDYNLNKIAKLEGIMILNLNDLANSLKPILLPGEEFELDVIKEGKENNQGVGYLDDGTMVVVANGLNLIGKRINVRVTSIHQTSAGRIIFTEPRK